MTESNNANEQTLLKKQDNGSLVGLKATKVSFSGPLPPPEILKQYSEIIPNAAERIMKMAEKEQENSMVLSNAFIKYQFCGQFFAFLIVIISFVTTIVLSYLGHPTTGLIISGTTLLGVVTAFIYGKNIDDKEQDSQ